MRSLTQKKLPYNSQFEWYFLRRISLIELSRENFISEVKNNACQASYCFTAGILILSESLSECQNNKQTRKKKSMLVYPAHHVKRLSAPPPLFFLSPAFSTEQQAGVICAATACEYQNSWLFSQVGENLCFIHMQVQVSASAFRASWGFSLRQSVNAEAAMLGAREANPGRTTWNINALCRTTSLFLAQKLRYHSRKKPFSHYSKSYQKVWLGSLISIL